MQQIIKVLYNLSKFISRFPNSVTNTYISRPDKDESGIAGFMKKNDMTGLVEIPPPPIYKAELGAFW